MNIELWVRYSSLDKCYNYQLAIGKQDSGSTMWWWIWFYLGKYLKKKIRLYPYIMDWNSDNKKLGEWKSWERGSETIAKWIVRKIEKFKEKK